MMSCFHSSCNHRPSTVLLQQPPQDMFQEQAMRASSSKLDEVPISAYAYAAAAPPRTELAVISFVNGGILPLLEPQQQQQQQLLPKPPVQRPLRRRRVRFQLPESSSKNKKAQESQQQGESSASARVVVFSDEQKSQLWVQKSDIRATVKKMQCQFCGIQQNSVEAADLAAYGEALTAAYVACALVLPQFDAYNSTASCSSSRQEEEEEIFAASLTAQHVGLFSLMSIIGENAGESPYQNRGLETCASPLLAIERSNKRRGDIRTVVGLYQLLRQAHKELLQEQHVLEELSCSLLLRSVAEQLSSPSRKFAQVIGVSDSMAALVEYGSPCTTRTTITEDSSSAASCRKRSFDDDNEDNKVAFPQLQKMKKTSSPAHNKSTL